jgi:hypothetical protein
MAEFSAPGAPGGNTNNGPATMNGSSDAAFSPSNAVQPPGEAAKTLWMGEMEGWMDETFIKNVFQTVAGENVQVKVIRDRNSGLSSILVVGPALPFISARSSELLEWC